jgi:hypothetical protein
MDEILEPTFYTHAPATSPAMKEMIRRNGGGGIVVSLHECLQHYPVIRRMLEPLGIAVPADPRELREWSLVMAMTGVLNAVDRDILPVDGEIMVHASGSYGTSDYRPIPSSGLHEIADEDGLAEHVAVAAA